jgi:hypothetical protein
MPRKWEVGSWNVSRPCPFLHGGRALSCSLIVNKRAVTRLDSLEAIHTARKLARIVSWEWWVRIQSMLLTINGETGEAIRFRCRATSASLTRRPTAKAKATFYTRLVNQHLANCRLGNGIKVDDIR